MYELTNLFGHNRDESIVDVDPLSNLDDLGEVGVVQEKDVLGALLAEGLIHSQLDLGAGLQGQLHATIILKQIFVFDISDPIMF